MLELTAKSPQFPDGLRRLIDIHWGRYYATHSKEHSFEVTPVTPPSTSEDLRPEADPSFFTDFLQACKRLTFAYT